MIRYVRCEALRGAPGAAGSQCSASARDGHVHDLEGTARRVCPLHWRRYHEGANALVMKFARRHPEFTS